MSPSPETPDACSLLESYRRRFREITRSGPGDSPLTEAEEGFVVLSNATNDAIWDCNLDSRTMWWNDTYQELFGRRRSDEGSPDWWIERIHPEDRDRVVAGLESALAGTGNHWLAEYRFRLANGTYGIIRDRTFIARRADGSPRRLISAKSDLSEQRRVEAELRDTASILQSFYDSVPTCVGVLEMLDADFEVLHANPASCVILRVSPDEARGCRLGVQGMPPEILREWRERYRESSEKGAPVRFEYFSPASRRWFGATISAVKPGPSGRPRLVYAVDDITSYRHTVESYRESEDRFRRLYESNIIGIVSGDEERVIEANDVFLQMVGYTREDVAAGRLRWHDITAPEHRHLGAQTVADVRAKGSSGPFEKDYLRKDGSRISVLIGCIHLQDSPYRELCFVLDLTDRKRLQQRVLEAQKFESVGVLAGGLAHDFNNLLVGVIGHASLAQDQLPPGHKARELLSQVIRNGEQAAHLTRQMLAYSGKGRFVLELLDLSTLFEEISILVRPAISREIELEMNLPPDLPAVEGDRGQMRQVFTNLVLNAAEAIEGQGHIWVETGVRQVYDPGAEAVWAAGEIAPGRYVYLEVIDTGCGMDEVTRSKIFDPFYTTKFVGRGLGLAAVAGIVRGHRGAISVTSAPGHGSRFLVMLPVSPQAAPAGTSAANALGRRAKGVVLVVDDEVIVRQIARTALERHGYEVVLASTGAEAIDLFRQSPQ